MKNPNKIGIKPKTEFSRGFPQMSPEMYDEIGLLHCLDNISTFHYRENLRNRFNGSFLIEFNPFLTCMFEMPLILLTSLRIMTRRSALSLFSYNVCGSLHLNGCGFGPIGMPP